MNTRGPGPQLSMMTRFKPSAPARFPAFRQLHLLPSYHRAAECGESLQATHKSQVGTPEAHCRPPPGILQGDNHEHKTKLRKATMRAGISGAVLTVASVVIVGLAYIAIGGIFLIWGAE